MLLDALGAGDSEPLGSLAAVGDLHQLAGAPGADADLLEPVLPFSPRGGRVLELLEVQTGSDVVLFGFLGGPFALGDVRLDQADELRRSGGKLVGISRAGGFWFFLHRPNSFFPGSFLSGPAVFFSGARLSLFGGGGGVP